MYLDTHIILRTEPLEAWRATSTAVGALVGSEGCWAARRPDHPLFLAALRVAVHSIFNGERNCHSSVWLERALHEAGGEAVALLRVKENQLIAPGGIELGRARYEGYDQDRVWIGGEDPKELARRGEVLSLRFSKTDKK